MRAAIIGARGIGKHHAKWYALCGCKVVAFVGASEALLQETAKVLHGMFGFDGNGYTDCSEMLRKERPDIVSVCSPHNLHYEHTMLALSHMAHVMCEKPMVWDERLSHERLLSQAREMAEEARARNLLLAVNTQYAALAEHLLQLSMRLRGFWEKPKSFEMHMSARRVGRDESGVGLWMDLSAHPISVIMRLFPMHEIDEEKIEVIEADRSIRVRFELCATERDEAVKCHLTLCRVGEGESPQRYIKFNGFTVSISGREEGGIYRSCILSGDVELVCEDFMHTSVRRFVEAVRGCGMPLCTADEGIQNLEWQLKVARSILEAMA